MASVLQEHVAAHEDRGGLHAGQRHFAAHELAAISEALERGKEHDPDPRGDPYFDERIGEAFTPADIRGWGVDVALSLVGRLVDGSHPVQDQPAVAELEDSAARLVLVGCLAYESFRGVGDRPRCRAATVSHRPGRRPGRRGPRTDQADTSARRPRRPPAALRPMGVPRVRAGRGRHALGQARFAVVDLAREGLRVRHVDENGEVYADETI